MLAFDFLWKWFRPGFDAPIQPDRPLAAIGDIHGRADLLRDLLVMLEGTEGHPLQLIFVGDYIDRGEASAEVLALLQHLQGAGWPEEVLCLRGNHEEMLLGFLDAPETMGQPWMRNGGAQTLASFGVAPPDTDPDSLLAARDALRRAMGQGTERWLRNLPAQFRSGNLFFAHAGANPRRPLEAQAADTLVWGHPEFLQMPRGDGVWVVHGHTIVDTPSAEDGRISLDTGGYATHRLTAALLSEGACRFIETRS